MRREHSEPGAREPLAVVGLGCRFPGGADGPDSFWRLLLDRVDAVGPVPPERWHPRHHVHAASDQGGFLGGIDLFDPLFFGLSPREAARMDPQQRLLLEVAWETLEDAGLTLDRLWGSATGVFVGLSNRDYTELQSLRTVGTHSSTGEAGSIVANRLSYLFHLTGPSMTVDTACSSGLTAVHLACSSLWSGECTTALAGAVNLMLHPRVAASFTAMSMLSPDGRCRAFDASGRGFVRGEGAGMVALRPLSLALADGDPIYALVLATAVNQDGNGPGMTVPSQEAQARLIRTALERAGVDPADVGYVEAHGTGTPVGDPIEARALASALGPTILGSVKTNLGHLEPAAGLAGLIKAALAVRHRTVPPNLHFESPNLELPAGLRVPVVAEPLPGRAVGVNSFGFGGSNAHAVLGLPPEPVESPGAGEPPFVLLLSGQTPEALEAAARDLEPLLDLHDPADLVAAAALRRTHHACRRAVLGSSVEELRAGLRGGPEAHDGRASGREEPPVVFLFTGQGSQWEGMGRSLLAREPVFRATVEAVDAVVRDLGGWSVIDELQNPRRLQETAVVQPVLFALQMGLVALLESCGVKPAAVLGHSMGEVAAACTAGVLSLETASRVIFHRAAVMGRTLPGRMLAVGLSEAEVSPWLDRGVTVAAVNGPALVTLAGEPDAVDEVQQALDEAGVFCRPLAIAYAFHHARMDPIKDELLERLADVRPAPARVPLASSVTGVWTEASDWDGGYQWRNVREPVRFVPAMEALLDAGHRTFLEIGPHAALCRSVGDLLDLRGERGRAIPTLRQGDDDRLALRRALARLHVGGVRVRWEALFPPGRPVRLPRYPWQRERLWVEDPAGRRARLESPDHPLLGHRADGPETAWQGEISLRTHPWLADHRLGDHPLLPAAAFLEMALAASGGEVRALRLERALFLSEDPADVRVALDGDRFTVWSRMGEEAWTLHASGRVRPREAAASPPALDLGALKRGRRLDGARLQEDFRRRGLVYGPAFQGLREAWVGEGEVLGRVEAPDGEGWRLHPAALDACLQACLLLLPDDGRTRLPVGVGSYRLLRRPPGDLYVHVRGAEARIVDGAGLTVALLEGLELRPVEEAPRTLYRLVWESSEAEPGPARRWRLLGDSGALARALRSLGHEVVEEGADGVVDLREPDLAALVETACSMQGERLVVATRHAFADPVDPRQTALWGLVRTVASERPDLRPRLIDGGSVEALAREIASASDEPEVSLGAIRRVRRLRRVTLDDLAREAVRPREGAVRLARPRSGVLEDLVPVACGPEPPGPGEVSVEVRAAGVNFSDVLKAMGLYPGTPGGALDMGLELAGVVAEVGEGVDLRPGDRVLGLARRGGALGTRVRTTPALLQPIPEGLSFAQAGAVPVAFLTAWYALWHKGRLQPGETVLVHSASGGVGLAALEMARWSGATVLATAGTAEKRDLLRGLGVAHVFDSRSLDFVEGVREATGGRGVDLVLNSLAGEALAAGLEVLAPHGRFLELGKRDIYADSRLGLGPLRNNLSFFAIDLEQVIAIRPDLIEEGLEVVARGFREGRLHLPPVQEVPLGEAGEAFRTLAAARHVGKIVLEMAPVPAAPDPVHVPVPREGTVVVTGGLSGFGAQAARWLAAQGARRLALVGRRGADTPGAADLAADLRALGAEVEVLAADVGDPAQARQVVERCRPVTGVLHAAMVLQDAPLERVDAAALEAVLRPKAGGAWNLHEATRTEPVELFVTFSSVAPVFGNPGQAAYCAANDFLEGLAAHRRGLGLPALSVQWGAVGDAGTLVERADLRRHVERMGLVAVPAAEALETLGALLALEAPGAVVARVDWPRLARALGGTRPVFADLVGGPVEGAVAESGHLVQRLRERLAGVVGVTADRVDPARPLTDLGLDSLMMFEVRNWLSDSLGVGVSAAELLKGPTLEELAASLSGRTNGHAVVAAEEPAPAPVAPPAEPLVRAARLEELPDFQDYQARRRAVHDAGLEIPYFRAVEGLNGPSCVVEGRPVVNFCSYNYVGLAGHPEVDEAAVEAIRRFGTSVSASRLAAGERPVHRDLERALARFLGTEDALALVSGHATNTALIPHLVGPGDLVVHDSLIHNSALQGAVASRATRRAFAHGDMEALDRLLREQRGRHRRSLVIVEGLYSMDGDFPDLPRLLELKDRHGFLLLVDEAHSLGVLGATGRGLAEEAGLSRAGDVIWMGTLSKALASCGGYLAGSAALIDWLKHTLGGFVFSVGMPPASAAAALAAVRVLDREPERVRRLRQRSADLRDRLVAAGFDVGLARGAAVVPVLVGDTQRCMALSQRLWEDGVHVSPAIYPAVAPDESRLRFFVTSEHTPEHLARALEALRTHLPAAR